MRPPHFYLRAIGITIAVCAATAAIGALANKFLRRGIENSQVGRISRGIDAFTPDIQRRDKEVEELIRP